MFSCNARQDLNESVAYATITDRVELAARTPVEMYGNTAHGCWETTVESEQRKKTHVY